MNLSAILNYYKNCFEADNRELTISNFFSAKVENSTIVEGKEELVNGFLPYLPMDTEEAVELQKEIQLYSREKELMYCSFFILGKEESSRIGKSDKLMTPLFLFPAEIVEENELFYLKIDFDKRRFNYSALSSLKKEDEDSTAFYNDLIDVTSSIEINSDNIMRICNILEKYIDGIDTTPIVEFPNLWSLKKIKKSLQPKQLELLKGTLFIPASGYGMVRKTGDALGILAELNTMIEQNNFSNPIKAIFANEIINEGTYDPSGCVPAILNPSQQKIIEASHRYPVSQITGPPGTGKTYTIAAMALEYISRGKSVLVVSRTEQAVDVVATKIEDQLGLKYGVVRGGSSSHTSQLSKFLKSLLGGNDQFDSDATVEKRIKNELDSVEIKINHLEQEFNKRTGHELDWGKYLAELSDQPGLFDAIKKKYIDWQSGRKIPLWDLIENLNNALDKSNELSIHYIQTKLIVQLKRLLAEQRNSLSFFHKALNARTGSKQKEYFASVNFKELLKAFPMWFIRMGDIYKVLPLQNELFDIAIIDEATQCDTTTCIPILQRAKKVVIAGDPMQLRHVSFLSGARQLYLLDKNKLENEYIFDYRNNSFLDVVSDQLKSSEQVVFLNEHFRSQPSIIRFSNQHFYHNSLNIMTHRPGHESIGGVLLHLCNGKRNAKGVNDVEAHKIIGAINAIVKEQKDYPIEMVDSLGILSPFRAQVEHINKLLASTFEYRVIDRHKLRAGTAYSFQGEERCRMFLSFALDDDSHSAAYNHINKTDVFNVSITRARKWQCIYYSFDYKKLKQDSLLRNFIEMTGEEANTIATATLKDQFAEEVVADLKAKDIKVWHSYPVAGMPIDLIAKYKDTAIGIDLIGYPGEYEDVFTLERYKMFCRAGFKTYPLPYSRWMFDRNNCINELLLKLKISV